MGTRRNLRFLSTSTTSPTTTRSSDSEYFYVYQVTISRNGTHVVRVFLRHPQIINSIKDLRRHFPLFSIDTNTSPTLLLGALEVSVLNLYAGRGQTSSGLWSFFVSSSFEVWGLLLPVVSVTVWWLDLSSCALSLYVPTFRLPLWLLYALSSFCNMFESCLPLLFRVSSRFILPLFH